VQNLVPSAITTPQFVQDPIDHLIRAEWGRILKVLLIIAGVELKKEALLTGERLLETYPVAIR
jgi:hypothetical protein